MEIKAFVWFDDRKEEIKDTKSLFKTIQIVFIFGHSWHQLDGNIYIDWIKGC